MVKVTYKTIKSKINQILVSGHANSTEIGENDLVCAGVSAIVFGFLNSLNPKHNKIVVLQDEVKITVINMVSREQILLTALLTSLTTIEKSYQKYIKIKEVK